MAIGRPITLTPNISSKNISIAATEGQTEFTVTGGYRINDLAVYRNGVRLVDGRDYAATDGQTVTLISDTVIQDDILEFSVIDNFNVAGVIVGAASTQTLNGNLHVTGELYAGTFVPGNIVATAGTFDNTLHVGSAITVSSSGDVETIGISTATGVDVTSNLTVGSGITFGSAGVATFSGTSDIHLHDNVRLNIGDASDLAIYHNGSNSFIQDTGTGSLFIDGTIVYLRNTAGDEHLANFHSDGAANLYYNGSLTFSTTDDGTTTTGICSATDFSGLSAGAADFPNGINVANTKTVAFPGDGATGATIKHQSGHFEINNDTGNVYFDSAGNILLRTNGSTAALTLDTSQTATFAGSITVQKAGNADIQVGSTNAGGARIFLDGDSNGDFTGSDYSSIVHNTDGNLVIKANAPGTSNCYIQVGGDGDYAAMFKEGAESLLRYDNSTKIETTYDGVVVSGMTTTSAGMSFNGMLKEETNIVANKLSAATNINLEDGMIHYFSTNETTTATPNVRFSSTKTLNNMMSVGETVTVTIIYKPNGAGYYAQLTIDGSGETEEWNGGSAPSSANAGGFDVLTHNITKTGNAAWMILSNVQNYA